MINEEMVTTGLEIPKFRVTKVLGISKGISVRSRSVIGRFGADLQQFFGGKVTMLSSLCETTRMEAFRSMIKHAEQLGANAIIGMRFDTTEMMSGVSEVLAYGTAVFVKPE